MTTVQVSTGQTGKKPTKSPRNVVLLDARLTVKDWAALPETQPRYELIEGELRRKMSTKRRHSISAFRLAMQLELWGAARGWTFSTEGLGLKIDDYNVFVPDVIGYAPGYFLDPEKSYDEGAFLVAEVISPSSAKDDKTRKRDGYEHAGVPIYVLVDSAKKTLTIFRLQEGRYGTPEVLEENAVWQPAELPGLNLELAKLWM